MTARPATVDDVDELIRLRAVMLREMSNRDWNDDWREPARVTLLARLGSTLAGFVVDRPDGAGLASCALGAIETRLGNPSNASGQVGYVFNVATDPDQRRRGHSRACVTALLAWFAARDIHAVDLRASPDGEPLYRSLGFRRTADPAMRLRLPG